jgi:hypothetical protein
VRFNKFSAVILISGVMAAAAQAAGVADNSMIGKVDTVYVGEARGLYIEKKLLRKIEDKKLWVDVHRANSLPGMLDSELFQVPADMAVERGDLVATQFGDQTPRDLKLIPVENRLTALVARHDTLMAMTFGLPNAPKIVESYLAKEGQ